MSKKTSKKLHQPLIKHPSKRTRAKVDSPSYISYLIIGFSVILIAFFIKFALTSFYKPHVMGVSVLGTHDENTNIATHGTQQDSTSIPGTNNINSTTHVDCVGPDNKHFQTSYQDCAKLNSSWGRTDFQFTNLKTTSVQVQNVHQTNTHQVNDNPTFIKPGNQVEIRPHDTSVEVKTTNSDGLETEVPDTDTEKAMNELNKDLDSIGVELDASDGSNITLRKGGVEAKSHLPLSINPQTKSLTVDTSNGKKAVNILPDQAIETVKKAGLLNSFESTSGTGTTSTGSASPSVTITQNSNQPVFEVNGFANKKLFGLFPVSYAKKVYISTENGSVVNTDETFLSKLLETFSF